MYINQITIDNQEYLIVLKDNKLNLYKFKNGNLSKLNLNFIKDTEETKLFEEITNNILELVRKDIEKKINKQEILTLDELEQEIHNQIGSINLSQIKDKIQLSKIQNSEEYMNMIKEFQQNLNNNKELDEKETIIEKSLDIDLKKLFEDNGITEYEINSTSSVISYVQNGIPHTINKSNSSDTIYENIVKKIDLAKSTSKEELKNEVNKIMETEMNYNYTQNQTLSSIDLLDEDMRIIAEFLQEHNYNINEIQGINPIQDSNISGMLMVKIGQEWIPIVMTEINGKKQIKFANKKELKGTKNPESETNFNKSLEIENKEKDIQNIDIENQMLTINFKLNTQEELNSQEKGVIKFYNEPTNFDTLPVKIREICLENIELYNNLNQKQPQLVQQQNYQKTLGVHPNMTPISKRNNEGYVNTLIITNIVSFALGIVTLSTLLVIKSLI